MEVDINLDLVHHKTDTKVVGPSNRDGRNLLRMVLTLGAGIAFGLVLAVCFLEGQSIGAASVRSMLSDSSLAKQNAAPEDKSVRLLHDIVRDWRPVVTTSPNTD
jgi:hypothetical protein